MYGIKDTNMQVHLELTKEQSSLIEWAIYFEEEKELEVKVRWMETSQVFFGVPQSIFEGFADPDYSFGKFYNQVLKPNFKYKLKHNHMADEKQQPKRINKAGAHTRRIDFKINLAKLNKDWFYINKDGEPVLQGQLVMKPDGEIGEYGDLGFLSQGVPSEIYKKLKAEGKDIPKGIILGNAEELDWKSGGSNEVYTPTAEEAAAAMDKLPF